MRTIIDAGFIVWGFFALYALVIIAYFAWMLAVERRAHDRRRARDNRE